MLCSNSNTKCTSPRIVCTVLYVQHDGEREVSLPADWSQLYRSRIEKSTSPEQPPLNTHLYKSPLTSLCVCLCVFTQCAHCQRMFTEPMSQLFNTRISASFYLKWLNTAWCYMFGMTPHLHPPQSWTSSTHSVCHWVTKWSNEVGNVEECMFSSAVCLDNLPAVSQD